MSKVEYECPYCGSKSYRKFQEVSGYFCVDCNASWEEWPKLCTCEDDKVFCTCALNGCSGCSKCNKG